MKHDNDNAAGNQPLRFLSVCSGIEAASVAWKPLGWEAVAFSEIEKFPSAVLAHHYPDTPNLGDFTKIDTSTLGQVDILCGGTPCQAFSVAGLRNSLADARGNLTLSFVRLAHELAGIEERPDAGPVRDGGERQPARGNGLRNAVWENVPGVLNTKDNAFGCFLGALVGADSVLIPSPKPADGKSNTHWKWNRSKRQHSCKWPDAGMVAGPKGRAAWRVLDAQYFGLAQRRKRVILVSDFGNGVDPAAVLFEHESVPGNPAPSREAGKGVAGATKGGAGSGGIERVAFALGSHAGAADGDQTNRSHASGGPVGAGISEEVAYSLRAGRTQAVGYAPEIARCDATREGSSQDYESTTMVAVAHETGQGWWKQDSIAGTLRAEGENRPSSPSHVVSVTGEIAHTLKAEGADASEYGAGRGTPIVAFQSKASATNSMNPSEISPALDVGKSDGLAICFTAKDYGADAQEDIAPTLRAGGHANSHANAGVMPAVTVALRGREGGAIAELGGDVATALRASTGGGDKPHVLYAPDTYPTLSASEGGTLTQVPPVVTSAVRRLTPVECERLMGFPDNYTRIPWRGKPAEDCPDGPRYKALGNSWAVPKFVWLGRRIQAHMPPPAANDNQDTNLAA